MSRFDRVAAQYWPYLSPPLQGLSEDMTEVTEEFGATNDSIVCVGDLVTALSEKVENAPRWLPPNFCFFGESIVDAGEGYTGYANVASGGRIIPTIRDNPGQNTTYMLTVVDEQAVAGPERVVVLNVGSNDAQQELPLADYKTNVKELVRRIRAAGKSVIISGPTPRNNPTADANVRLYNAWMARYAQAEGIPFIDNHSALVAAAGGWPVSSGAGDGVHPGPLGNKIMGELLVSTVSKMLTPATYVTQSTAGTPNLQPNSMFLLDGNSDGIPDGTNSTDTAAMSLVSDPAGFNWARATVTTGSPVSLNGSEITVASGNIAVGDVIRFSCLARSGQTGIVERQGWNVNLTFYTEAYAVAANVRTPSRNGGLSQQIDGSYVVDTTVPPNTSRLVWSLYPANPNGFTATNGTYDLAKPTVINLTKLGI